MAAPQPPPGPSPPGASPFLPEGTDPLHVAAGACRWLAAGDRPPEGAVPRVLAHLCAVCVRCTDQVLALLEAGELPAPARGDRPDSAPGGAGSPHPSSLPELETIRAAWEADIATAPGRLAALSALPRLNRLDKVRSDPEFRTLWLWKLVVSRTRGTEQAEERRELAELALAIADALDSATPAAMARDCAAASRVVLAWEHLKAGGVAAARSLLHEARGHAEKGSCEPILQAQIGFAAAACLLAEDRPHEAIDSLWQALDASCDAADLEIAGDVLVHLGLALHRLGESAEACGALAAGLSLGGAPDPTTRSHALSLLRQIQHHRRRQQAADNSEEVDR